MKAILAIAGCTWSRILKMKVVYFLILCAITEIGITIAYETLMLKLERQLTVDLSLVMVMLSALLVVLSLAFDIPKEIRDGSAATLLTKPISRVQYLAGKFLGIVVVGLVISTIISAGFCAVHHYAYDMDLPVSAVQGHILAILAVIPMAGVALLFAAIFSEAIAAILTTASIWFAHSTYLLVNTDLIAKKPIIASFSWMYAGLVPDLNLFNLRGEAAHNLIETWNYMYLAQSLLWGVLYSISMICLAGVFFNRRDLK